MSYLTATVTATAAHRRTITAKLDAPQDSSSADRYAGFLGGLDASLSVLRTFLQPRVDLLNQSANFVIGKGERSGLVNDDLTFLFDRP